jgi:hypothetical protein
MKTWNLIQEDFTLIQFRNCYRNSKTFKRVYRGYLISGAGTNVGQLNFSKGGHKFLRILLELDKL